MSMFASVHTIGDEDALFNRRVLPISLLSLSEAISYPPIKPPSYSLVAESISLWCMLIFPSIH